jgi:uncharacterized membrane protein required for colicin V production
MNISDISLLVVAAIPILYRGWNGFRYGLSAEIRHLLTIFFAMLVAIRLWQPCAGKLVDALNFDQRWVTIGAFVVLFTIAAVVAGVIFKVNARIFQSVQMNYPDKVLGLAGGLFSGALLGACILWLSTIAMPGKYDSVDFAKSLIDFPRDVFQSIETVVGVAPDSAARIQFPVASMIEVPVTGNPADVPPGTMLMTQQGQIAWK